MEWHFILDIFSMGIKVSYLLLFFVVILVVPSWQQETFANRLFAGYQGWFATPEDGYGMGWLHQKFDSSRPFARNNAVIDFWPDTSEYEQKYAVPEFPGYYLYSAADYSTVRTHFLWLQQNNIDGVFLQRFGADIKDKGSNLWKLKNKVF